MTAPFSKDESNTWNEILHRFSPRLFESLLVYVVGFEEDYTAVD